MKKIGQIIGSIKGFVAEVRVELGKCSWPTRPELMESTVVVIVSVIILGAFVWISDLSLMSVLKVIIR